jgi:hypothetical protein
LTRGGEYDSIDSIELSEKLQNIISVSRRTDIPAFYADWFVKRLKERFVIVQHPYTNRNVEGCERFKPRINLYERICNI